MTREATVRNLLTELIDMIDNGSQRDLDKAYEIGASIIKLFNQQPCEDATLKDIFCMGCEYKEQENRLGNVLKEIEERILADNRLMAVSGMSIEELTGAFTKGYRLVSPDKANDQVPNMRVTRATIDEARIVFQMGKEEPCGDCVNRQAVLDKKELVKLEDGQSFYCISPEDVKALPSVTPQQKIGHWIAVGDYFWKCSECRCCEIKKSDWCPSCGAMMKEVEE